MRALGWVAVALLVVFSVWGFSTESRPKPPPEEIIAETAEKLKTSPEPLRAEILSNLEDQLPRDDIQVFLAQGIPGQAATILTLPYDSSGEEQASHWPAPWPRLSETLANGPNRPQEVLDRRHGIRYVHHVYPIDVAARHYLVITAPARSSGFRRVWPWIGLGGALVLTGLLLLPHGSDS